uniref:Uncharacterized protein n=1 Tax=Arion vulgaris TaxID=1028688 RepID=A0A0B7BJD3_9EUPU
MTGQTDLQPAATYLHKADPIQQMQLVVQTYNIYSIYNNYLQTNKYSRIQKEEHEIN